MAGKGSAPKSNGRDVRSARNAQPTQVVRFEAGVQPPLPEGYDWPERTRAWWEMWGNSPLSESFSQTDWDFLLDTALLHAAAWGGNMSAMAELRLRVAKFGATPEDRARLRIQFADADDRDQRNAKRGTGEGAKSEPKDSRERYGNVTKADFGKQEKSG